MMKPEPSELTRRGALSESPLSPPCPRCFLKKSSKNCSIGEPGGRSGMPEILASTFCEVDTLTTASITCSATSAIFSGPRAAAGPCGNTMMAAVSAAITPNCRDMNWRDMDVSAPERDLIWIGKCPRPAPGARPNAAGRHEEPDWGGKATEVGKATQA